ncbi:X-ray repair cross-complementing protein 6 [Anabrus simplex]|uniref:X-ray repair cross-complementing protein 6 n=1 Tax=Anabrus simplex TaxID=316456 RepID=UPI0035A2A73C
MSTVTWDDSDDENNEDEENSSEWGGRDGVIFLIDATRAMFTDEDGDIPFRTCIECCKTTMLNKIIGSAKDLIGVVLFGTDKSDSPDMKHITVLQEFSQPSSEKIQQLEKMLKSDIAKYCAEEYGHSDDFSLSDALWQCQRLFSNCTLKLASQRIFLFTCNDNPHADDPHRQRQALDRARTLGQSGIDLELLHMGKNFDVTLFYQELVQEALGEDSADFTLPVPSTKLDELLTRVCRQNHKKRSVGRLIFKLGPQVEISVAVYNLVRRTPAPKKVWLDRRDNETLHPLRQSYDGSTGDIILPMDVDKFQVYGGERIIFQPEEVKNVRQLMDQGIYLMGFKPENRIKLHHHYKPAAFIYPDDTKIRGSRKLFAALLERCIARKVVPICWLSTRLNSPPQLVALVPQQEKFDDSKVQILPPGFHVVYLPFAENIRTLEVPEIEQATPEQLNLMKKIVSKLRFNYSPHSFDNPKLQTLWSNIEALAMGYESPREVIDYTEPDCEMMSEKLGDLAAKFQKMFYPPGFDPEAKGRARSSAVKRAAPASGSAKVAKAVKTENFNMADLAAQGKVEKCKVDELKDYLIGENVRVTGKKKADLVSMVYEHLGIYPPK